MYWRTWLSFSRKERRGLLILCTLLLMQICIPRLLSLWLSEPRASLEEFFPYPSDSIPKNSLTATHAFGVINASPYPFSRQELTTPALFPFDPNHLDESGWRRLGVRPRTIATILRYRQKGGLFKRSGDLKRIYGFTPEEVQRLIPFVQLPDTLPFDAKDYSVSRGFAPQRTNSRYTYAHPLDLNKADSADLLNLPGIGPYFAHRILQYRDKLGGYVNVAQVAEIYGMPDSTFQRVQQQIRCKGVPYQKLEINKATAPQLSLHPYISRSAAREIIRYREQHGYFRDTSALTRLMVLAPEQLAKLLPYISWEIPQDEGKNR